MAILVMLTRHKRPLLLLIYQIDKVDFKIVHNTSRRFLIINSLERGADAVKSDNLINTARCDAR